MADTPGVENPQDYGLTEEQARTISLRYLLSPSQFRQQEARLQQRILSRLRFGDLPRQRAEFAAQFLRGDDNKIAPDGYTIAADRLNEMRALQPDGLRSRVAGMPAGPLLAGVPFILQDDAGLAPDNTGWKALGPGNIGGRIRSILISPAAPRTMYVGSVGGGAWVSTDGAASWQPCDDLMANLAVCSMAMVSNGPLTTIYAGTGEGYYGDIDKAQDTNFIPGNGIFKTTDGWTWRQLENTKVQGGNTDFRWVNGLAANRDGSVVLAGTRTGIFRSTDGGATWTKAQSGVVVGNILFNPTDDTRCVAGMLEGGGIYYSTDRGTTWQKATNPAGSPTIGRVQVCYAAQNTGIVYASAAVTAPTMGSQIWASTDGGQSFAKKASTINYLGTQGWYDNVIWAGDSTNSNFVIVGGQDLYKSTDGGNTLTKISAFELAPNSSAHADHHVIVADPGYGTSNKTVYFGNDGGLYKAVDVTTVTTNTGWTNLNSKLPITQFYSVSGKFTTVGGVTTIASIVGGTQDNGTLRYTPAAGANAWTNWARGDGGYVASDPSSANNYYGEGPNLGVFRSTDGAGTSDDICGSYWNGSAFVWKPAPYTIADAQTQNAQFIAPVVLASGNSNALFAGGSSLWQTLNPLAPNTPTTGPSWSVIKPAVAGAKVSAIAAVSSTRAVVGYSNGQIYRATMGDTSVPVGPSNGETDEAAFTWARIDTGIGATRMCTSVAIDNIDESIFYATFGGFQANNIWRTLNQGVNWSSIGGALPPVPIYCVAIHPQNSQWLYIGTEVGIFASEDSGQTWTPINEGPTNCRVYQLVWMGNTLCCASHGRGMFSIDLTIRQQASLVLTGDSAGNLIASDARTGARVSSRATASAQITAAPLVDGTAAYCAYAQPAMLAKFGDVRNLGAAPAWQVTFAAGIAFNATPCLVKGVYPGDADVLYVVAANGVLSALNAATGASLWAVQVVPADRVGTGVTVYSNQMMNQWIYVATDKGLYTVNTQTRTLGWSTTYGCSAAPLLAANTVFVPAQSGILYSLQARTGAENWQYDTHHPNLSIPVWLLGSVIAGNQNGGLNGLDYQTSTNQFFVSFADEQVQAIAADGKQFYFASAPNYNLYAYQLNIAGTARTVRQLWAVQLPSAAVSAPQLVGTSLYLATANSKLRAVNATTGATLWEQTLPGVARGGPVLVYG